ncbi:T-cell-specific surface glycoprotein CD28 [Dendropsophus ebraccatus]|uniref:T-cell-specific surface glycoprotein CD28 n=1 Tax=Dendropsophus ebraccatus TaxID=150705 RepID=UPI0038314C64
MNDKVTVTLYYFVTVKTMALGKIWSMGLIMLVQSIGFFVEGENCATVGDDSCPLPPLCDKRLQQSSDSSYAKNRVIFYAYKNNNLTFHHNFTAKSKEFKVILVRGFNKPSSVCVGAFNASWLPVECHNCRVAVSESQFTIQLQNFSENDTDFYFVCKEIMYPPPYICECEGILIHVITEHKEHSKQEIVREVEKVPLSFAIILGCMVAYSLLITTSFAYILRNKRRTRIQQSDYINVVPRRPKNHKPYIPYATSPVHPCTR